MNIKYFNEIVKELENFWVNFGFKVFDAKKLPIGAATYHDAGTFFSCLSQEDVRIAFLQPCCRPHDFIDNVDKSRSNYFYQYQVLLSPAEYPFAIQLFKDSLRNIGFDVDFEHQIDFLEDNWNSPSIGAFGVGWEARINGLEIAQITYINKMGGIELDKPFIELAYGMDRIAMILQKKDSIKLVEFDETMNIEEFIEKSDDWNTIKNIGSNVVTDVIDVLKILENKYPENIESIITALLFGIISKDVSADINLMNLKTEVYESLNRLCGVDSIYEAYNRVLLAIHVFNVLDSKKMISHSQRDRFLLHVMGIVKIIAGSYLDKVKSNVSIVEHYKGTYEEKKSNIPDAFDKVLLLIIYETMPCADVLSLKNTICEIVNQKLFILENVKKTLYINDNFCLLEFDGVSRCNIITYQGPSFRKGQDIDQVIKFINSKINGKIDEELLENINNIKHLNLNENNELIIKIEKNGLHRVFIHSNDIEQVNNKILNELSTLFSNRSGIFKKPIAWKYKNVSFSRPMFCAQLIFENYKFHYIDNNVEFNTDDIIIIKNNIRTIVHDIDHDIDFSVNKNKFRVFTVENNEVFVEERTIDNLPDNLLINSKFNSFINIIFTVEQHDRFLQKRYQDFVRSVFIKSFQYIHIDDKNTENVLKMMFPYVIQGDLSNDSFIDKIKNIVFYLTQSINFVFNKFSKLLNDAEEVISNEISNMRCTSEVLIGNYNICDAIEKICFVASKYMKLSYGHNSVAFDVFRNEIIMLHTGLGTAFYNEYGMEITKLLQVLVIEFIYGKTVFACLSGVTCDISAYDDKIIKSLVQIFYRLFLLSQENVKQSNFYFTHIKVIANNIFEIIDTISDDSSSAVSIEKFGYKTLDTIVNSIPEIIKSFNNDVDCDNILSDIVLRIVPEDRLYKINNSFDTHRSIIAKGSFRNSVFSSRSVMLFVNKGSLNELYLIHKVAKRIKGKLKDKCYNFNVCEESVVDYVNKLPSESRDLNNLLSSKSFNDEKRMIQFMQAFSAINNFYNLQDIYPDIIRLCKL